MSATTPSATGRLSRSATNLWLLLVAAVVIAPVVYALTGAFRDSQPTSLLQQFLPTPFTTDNFGQALERVPLGRQLINSAIVTFAQAGLQAITAILAAAAIAFGQLRRPGLVFALLMITMMLPGESIVVAQYLIINDFGLYDTLLAVFLPHAAAAFPIFLMRQAFLSFPKELHEAARLDGCGPLRFVWSILVPLCRPTIMAVLLTSAIAAWNGYLWPLLVTETSRARTVQVGITQLSNAESTDIGVVLAGVTVVIIPMLILITIGQRHLARGLTEGSLK